MKIIIYQGYLALIFKDSDTVTLTDTKLSATETNSAGDSESWEDTAYNTANSQLLESVTAEDLILGTWSQGPRLWDQNNYGVNQGERNASN